MKKLISVLIVLCLLGGGGAFASLRVSAMSVAGKHASTLQQVWATDESEGVSPLAFSHLQTQLKVDETAMNSGVFSPSWWTTPVPASISTLTSETNAIWSSDLKRQQLKAEQQLASMTQLEAANTTWLVHLKAPSIATWTTELQDATTPKAAAALASTWSTSTATLHTQITAAQHEAAIASAEGTSGVLGTATAILNEADGMNLQTGDVGALASEYKAQLAAGSPDAEATSAQLVSAEQQLQATINLNNTLYSTNYSIEVLVDQAESERTPASSTELATYSSLSARYQAAQTKAALVALQTQYASLEATVNADLAAHVCGHTNVQKKGQAITISLSLEEMVFYDNGCVVNATPVTTGRPGRPTPTGSYYVYDKITPFEMISGDPTSSPFWYPPTWVTWVMGIAGPGMPEYEGYFIHNAYWEPNGVYGPGSQNGADASHGCIHTPYAVMQWAYTWTDIGTPVTITP